MKTALRLTAAALAIVLAPGLCPPAGAASPGAAKAMGHAIADMVERVMPSVVVVRTEATRYYLTRDPYFGRLYRIPEPLAGLGSGVIVSKDGFVLTNRHVVDDAEHIEVALSDGTKHSARLVGEDPHTDLAVLKIDAPAGRAFVPIEPGDSDGLRVGEFVIAIGSPFSLDSSVTLGIVSQKGRSIGALPYEDFIQTDASVNRGNSGGPLVDMDGRMVGVNTLITTSGRSEGNIGISFAIPANLAMRVAGALMKEGEWRRPWIGILMEEADQGVAIARVVPGGPAAGAGLHVGDMIVAIENAAVRNPRDVQRAIMNRKVGEAVRLTVLRGGDTVDVTFNTAAMPAPAPLPRP